MSNYNRHPDVHEEWAADPYAGYEDWIADQQASVAEQSRGAFKQVYICLPRELATHPPLRRRGDPPQAGLSVFEFALVGGCCALARSEYARAREKSAFETAKAELKSRRKRVFDRDVHRGQGWAAKKQAAATYDRKHETDDIAVHVKRWQLLRAAGLVDSRRNLHAVDDALRQLAEPVGHFPAVIKSSSATKDGGWTLLIDAKWVPRRRFVRVPWPAPTKGITQLALHLFLAAVRPNEDARFETVCRRLGIAKNHAGRSLSRALGRVNAHRRKLNADGALDDHKLPVEFVIESRHGGNRMRFNVKSGLSADEEQAGNEEQSKSDDERFDAEMRRCSQPGEDGAGYRRFDRKAKQ